MEKFLNGKTPPSEKAGKLFLFTHDQLKNEKFSGRVFPAEGLFKLKSFSIERFFHWMSFIFVELFHWTSFFGSGFSMQPFQFVINY